VSIRHEPCPQCRTPVPVDARICAHCRSSLVVDLRLEHPVRDPRSAYHAGRELEQMLGSSPGFLELKHRLEEGTGTVLDGVTRELAERAGALLAEHGISTIVAASGPAADNASAPGAAYRPAAPARAAQLSPGLRTIVILLGLIVVLLAARGMITRRRDAHERPAGPTAALSSRELARLALGSSAQLTCPHSQGAGFFIGRELLVTNAHVLCEGTDQLEVVLADGRHLEGAPTRIDPWLDAALVRVPGANQPALELGDATTLHQGDRILIIGNPRGLDFTVAEGLISHPARAMLGIAYVQLDASIHPGNSGGPVLDAEGRAVAVVTMLVGPESGLGLALPVNYLLGGPEPMLPPVFGHYDAEAWQARLDEVSELQRRDVDRLRRNLSRPGLAAASQVAPGVVTAVVIRYHDPADPLPPPERLTFELYLGEHRLCWATGSISAWSSVAQQPDDLLTPRFTTWLERNGLARGLYAGAARLDLDGCPARELAPGTTLVLDGAAAGSNQVEIVPPPEPPPRPPR